MIDFKSLQKGPIYVGPFLLGENILFSKFSYIFKTKYMEREKQQIYNIMQKSDVEIALQHASDR